MELGSGNEMPMQNYPSVRVSVCVQLGSCVLHSACINNSGVT